MTHSALLLAWLSLALLPAAAVYGHGKSYSQSAIELTEGGADIELRVALRDLAWLPAARSEHELSDYLSRRLRVEVDGVACEAQSPRALSAATGYRRYTWRTDCGEERRPRTLRSALFLDVTPSHLHFVRVVRDNGTSAVRVLAEGADSWPLEALDPEAAGGSPFARYLALGIEHIATGFDHLAFVLGLLLLAGSLAEVATLVSGFTIAHSIALALATLGVVRPQAASVEALIGFSIALVALENGWLLSGRSRGFPALAIATLAGLFALALFGVGVLPPLVLGGVTLFAACHLALLARTPRPARLRAAVALAFGLVHGFGFAGILTELELPPARLALALAGFNLGVELGQLVVVVLAWPALRWLASVRPGAHRRLLETATAGVLGLGVYWFLTRALAS